MKEIGPEKTILIILEHEKQIKWNLVEVILFDKNTVKFDGGRNCAIVLKSKNRHLYRIISF